MWQRMCHLRAIPFQNQVEITAFAGDRGSCSALQSGPGGLALAIKPAAAHNRFARSNTVSCGDQRGATPRGVKDTRSSLDALFRRAPNRSCHYSVVFRYQDLPRTIAKSAGSFKDLVLCILHGWAVQMWN